MNSSGPVSVRTVIGQINPTEHSTIMINGASSVYEKGLKVTPVVIKQVQVSAPIPKATTEVRATSSGHNRTPLTALELCGSIIDCKEKNEAVENSQNERWSPPKVSSYVAGYVQRWGRVLPVHPEHFLQRILQGRGYDSSYIKITAREIGRCPSEHQIKDYDNDLVWAIRNSDIVKLKELYAVGKNMTACNRYSESIVHMACRRAERDIVEFLLSHGADFSIVDDYGRTALHDACWRPEPRFDIVVLIMDKNLDLVRHVDARGSIPLHYVREEHWLQWCAFLFNQIEKYWAPRLENSDEPSSKRARVEEVASS